MFFPLRIAEIQEINLSSIVMEVLDWKIVKIKYNIYYKHLKDHMIKQVNPPDKLNHKIASQQLTYSKDLNLLIKSLNLTEQEALVDDRDCVVEKNISFVIIKRETNEKFLFENQRMNVILKQFKDQDSSEFHIFSLKQLMEVSILKTFLPQHCIIQLQDDSKVDLEKIHQGNNMKLPNEFNQNFSLDGYHILRDGLVTLIFERLIIGSSNEYDFSKYYDSNNHEINRFKVNDHNLNKFNGNKEQVQCQKYKNNRSREDKRVNEKTLKEALQKVKLWRDIHLAANEGLKKDQHYISFEKVAALSGICKKKTLDYYYLEIRKAQAFSFDFENHLNWKMGRLRLFNFQQMAIHGEWKDKKKKEILFELPLEDQLPVNQQIVLQLISSTSLNQSNGKRKRKNRNENIHLSIESEESFEKISPVNLNFNNSEKEYENLGSNYDEFKSNSENKTKKKEINFLNHFEQSFQQNNYSIPKQNKFTNKIIKFSSTSNLQQEIETQTTPFIFMDYSNRINIDNSIQEESYFHFSRNEELPELKGQKSFENDNIQSISNNNQSVPRSIDTRSNLIDSSYLNYHQLESDANGLIQIPSTETQDNMLPHLMKNFENDFSSFY